MTAGKPNDMITFPAPLPLPIPFPVPVPVPLSLPFSVPDPVSLPLPLPVPLPVLFPDRRIIVHRTVRMAVHRSSPDHSQTNTRETGAYL
ncbi:hypothetical protein GCM10010140_77830 [Streptosporangium pseudovulgare]|uniref:Uncharacterized protein n=1 Tax=Streptosporangium pseudovulgare TaxID=35765 RepID=A0ABQ2RPC0_9ACTN|nr:hypothetical protein GCM10010140_77830 [Streptosporangium pseudovulgare]